MQKKSRKKIKIPAEAVAEFPFLDMHQTSQVDYTSTGDFYNRELSWLLFNRRVLQESMELRNPLVERLKFLTIYHSNLDEFFMKRVGALKRLSAMKYPGRSIDGLTVDEQLKKIRQSVLEDISHINNYLPQLLKELEVEEVRLLHSAELSSAQKIYVDEFFFSKIFPLLTPLSVDPGHPFPFISNLSTSLAVSLKSPLGHESYDVEEEYLFSRIKIPEHVISWIRLPHTKSHQYHFISVLEIIKDKIQFLFPGMHIVASMPFRITRNAELFKRDEDAEDLLQEVSEVLKEQKFAEVIRLEHDKGADPWLLNFIKTELSIEDEDIYEVSTPIHLSGAKSIFEINIPKLKFPTWIPVIPQAFIDKTNIFSVIKKHDILVHHPYESFKNSVEYFIRHAAEDPKVRTIKMTLYRTGDKSPFVDALIQAAESGKQVVCLVELKARFDEKRNIKWAQALEDVGVHVVYGLVGYKTHSKIALVIREEEGGHITSYAHIGTGNYNSTTSDYYTDLGLLTADEKITKEVIEVFNYLTGRSLKKDYQHLLVAPVNMKKRFLELIDREIEFAQNGKKAKIVAKMNSMEDIEIIQKLYKASQAGVEIILYVRGFCCIKPQIKNLSENIKVYSILGRFLEHSRFFMFLAGHENMVDGDFFIGSADWMYRNLHSRVEVITPVYDVKAKRKLCDYIHMMELDFENRWELLSNGVYQQMKKILPEHKSEMGSQEQMMRLFTT
jgi:polyphosphate kinase